MLNKQYAHKLINDSQGKIINVKFIKKDGSLRSMTCRTSVKKGVTGKGLAFNPDNKDLKVVYDLKKDNFRMINLNNVVEIKSKGQVYKTN